MKWLMFCVSSLVAIVLCAAQDTKDQSSPDSEKALRVAESRFRDGLLHQDTAVLEDILANDCSIAHANGRVQTKSQFIAAIKAGVVKFLSMTLDEVTIRIYGDTAVTTARSTNTIAIRDTPQPAGQVRLTSVYVKQQGRWRLVAEQATSIAER